MTRTELVEDLKCEVNKKGKAVLKSESVQLFIEDSRFETEEQFTERICGELGCYRNKNEDGDWEFARARFHF